MSVQRTNTPADIIPTLAQDHVDNRNRLSRANDSMDQATPTTSSAHSFSNRDAHVKLLMKHRETEFSHIETLRLFCGTWNVNGRPATEDLTPWLKHAFGQSPDIIALGFQELDLSKEALIFADSIRETEWREACETAVGTLDPKVQYRTLKVVRLVGVMLIIFVKEDLAPHVQNVADGTVATGIMSLLGNKGGAAVRLTVHSTDICLVTSHLAAHMEQVERRNQDYKDISEKMIFNGGRLDVNSNYLSISKHDQVFWFGDLNYRITDLHIDKVKDLIKNKNYSLLVEKDQLLKELASKKVFKSFSESSLTFDPTYKYDVGTDEYDTSEKMRVPAWTDRVLYKGKHIKPLIYDCHQELMLSDHKPVSHTFDIGVKIINKDNYRLVYEDVMKQLDKLENEYLPQVKLNVTELDYGNVKFMEPKTLTLEITNTGQVPADFSFIPKLNEESHCRDWMTVSPFQDSILPNETAVVELTIYVDEKTISGLNTGKEVIDDILVLHLEGGKDFFVSITGNYILSCFGSSLATLIQLPNPITESPKEQIFELERQPLAGSDTSSYQSTLPIPKELWFLCGTINRRGMLEEDLFQQRGLHVDTITIRETLDTSLTEELRILMSINARLPTGNVHSVVEALLVFLDSLREPVIPFELYDDALSAASDRTKCVELVSRLPEIHKRTMEYLVEFMLELLEHSRKNHLDPSVLGNVFGPVILRTNSKVGHTKSEKELLAQRKSLFVKNFLVEPSNGP